MGTDIKAHITAQEVVKPLGKKALGNILMKYSNNLH